MASTIGFVEYVCDCIVGCGHIRYRKMFGEYLVYVDDKPIFLVCDNRIFVKEFPVLKSVLDNVSMATPYPGAKMYRAQNEAYIKGVTCKLLNYRLLAMIFV